jgi:hypothetical protein
VLRKSGHIVSSDGSHVAACHACGDPGYVEPLEPEEPDTVGAATTPDYARDVAALRRSPHGWEPDPAVNYDGEEEPRDVCYACGLVRAAWVHDPQARSSLDPDRQCPDAANPEHAPHVWHERGVAFVCRPEDRPAAADRGESAPQALTTHGQIGDLHLTVHEPTAPLVPRLVRVPLPCPTCGVVGCPEDTRPPVVVTLYEPPPAPRPNWLYDSARFIHYRQEAHRGR